MSDAVRPDVEATFDETFWRGHFRWMLPRFNVYRPADTSPRFGLNRYPYNVIGACVVVFGRCFGVRWKRS